jgi:hypothetical protein
MSKQIAARAGGKVIRLEPWWQDQLAMPSKAPAIRSDTLGGIVERFARALGITVVDCSPMHGCQVSYRTRKGTIRFLCPGFEVSPNVVAGHEQFGQQHQVDTSPLNRAKRVLKPGQPGFRSMQFGRGLEDSQPEHLSPL